MKRYNMSKEQKGILPYEDPEGEWVRYVDVKLAVESYNGWVERGIWKEDGCNCAMKSEELLARGGNLIETWICPAHGYKRL